MESPQLPQTSVVIPWKSALSRLPVDEHAEVRMGVYVDEARTDHHAQCVDGARSGCSTEILFNGLDPISLDGDVSLIGLAPRTVNNRSVFNDSVEHGLGSLVGFLAILGIFRSFFFKHSTFSRKSPSFWRIFVRERVVTDTRVPPGRTPSSKKYLYLLMDSPDVRYDAFLYRNRSGETRPGSHPRFTNRGESGYGKRRRFKRESATRRNSAINERTVPSTR